MAKANAATEAQGESLEPTSAGAKVVVANKLPFALRIRNFRMRGIMEEQRDGTRREISVAEPLAETIVIHGAAPPKRGVPPCRIFMGYALTEGVDKDSFDNWLKDNKDQAFVLNKLVFAMPNVSDAEACAKENRDRVTNLEPLDPDGDPRAPRPAVGMSGIETATRE